MKRQRGIGMAVALVLALGWQVSAARADDKPDPNGTWKWEVERNGQKFETTLKLKLDGDKLTGTLTGRDNKEVKIEDAKYKDGEVSFKVEREFNGNKFTMKYKAKVAGDTIKGKVEFNAGGDDRSFDFEGKRVKEEKK